MLYYTQKLRNNDKHRKVKKVITMRTTKTNGEARNIDKICVTTEDLQDLLDCGRATAVEIGRLAGARIEVGKRLLWCVSKVQSYIDRLAEEQNKQDE
jgi:hypothetical protein